VGGRRPLRLPDVRGWRPKKCPRRVQADSGAGNAGTGTLDSAGGCAFKPVSNELGRRPENRELGGSFGWGSKGPDGFTNGAGGETRRG